MSGKVQGGREVLCAVPGRSLHGERLMRGERGACAQVWCAEKTRGQTREREKILCAVCTATVQTPVCSVSPPPRREGHRRFIF